MDQLKAIKITHRELDNLKYTESIFNNVSNVSLYVPEGTAKIYREFYPWKKFKEIVEYKNQNDEFLFNAYRVSYILSYSSNSNMSTRDLNNENVYIKTYCASGIDLEDVDAPIIDGYQFAGWSGIPKTMPAHDVTVTGTFNFIGNIKGDINNDGRVNVADIVALNNLIKSSTGSYSAAADLNNDGKVNDADVSILVQMIMGR